MAAKLGFPFGTLSGSGRERVIVLEFSRSAPCLAGDGTELRYGVAVRLAVKVSKYEARTSLTLPVVAAEAQLGRVEAQSMLLVRGYVGAKLGSLIPALEAFSVESYVNLMQRVSQIQALISQDTANIRPALLHVPPNEVEDEGKHDHALGVTWALSMLADGVSYERARSGFHGQRPVQRLVVR